jgi:hypothetical protein
MAQGALVFRWGVPVRGREQEALEVFGESMAYFEDLLKNHRISAQRPYISSNRNGGMWVLEGEMMELNAIRFERDFMTMVSRVQWVAEDYGVEVCYGGSAEDLAEVMGIYGETIQQHA